MKEVIQSDSHPSSFGLRLSITAAMENMKQTGVAVKPYEGSLSSPLTAMMYLDSMIEELMEAKAKLINEDNQGSLMNEIKIFDTTMTFSKIESHSSRISVRVTRNGESKASLNAALLGLLARTIIDESDWLQVKVNGEDINNSLLSPEISTEIPNDLSFMSDPSSSILVNIEIFWLWVALANDKRSFTLDEASTFYKQLWEQLVNSQSWKNLVAADDKEDLLTRIEFAATRDDQFTKIWLRGYWFRQDGPTIVFKSPKLVLDLSTGTTQFQSEEIDMPTKEELSEVKQVNKQISVHPGEILWEEFLKPLSMTANALAFITKISIEDIQAILDEKAGITPEVADVLSRILHTTPQFWLNLQTNYESKRL